MSRRGVILLATFLSAHGTVAPAAEPPLPELLERAALDLGSAGITRSTEVTRQLFDAGHASIPFLVSRFDDERSFSGLCGRAILGSRAVPYDPDAETPHVRAPEAREVSLYLVLAILHSDLYFAERCALQGVDGEPTSEGLADALHQVERRIAERGSLVTAEEIDSTLRESGLSFPPQDWSGGVDRPGVDSLRAAVADLHASSPDVAFRAAKTLHEGGEASIELLLALKGDTRPFRGGGDMVPIASSASVPYAANPPEKEIRFVPTVEVAAIHLICGIARKQMTFSNSLTLIDLNVSPEEPGILNDPWLAERAWVAILEWNRRREQVGSAAWEDIANDPLASARVAFH